MTASIEVNNFDAKEYFNEILVDKYGSAIVERSLAICKNRDCFMEEKQIVKELTRPGLLDEDGARQLLCELSCLLILT